MKENEKARANPFYAKWMMAKALLSASKTLDKDVKVRVLKRAEKWNLIFQKMLENSII